MDLKEYIRDVPDFPKKGIVFKDITTLLKSPEALSATLDQMAAIAKDLSVDVVAGIESRGFLFGPALAKILNVGFVIIRKPGKLPAEVVSQEYELEYGTDTIEIHKDAIAKGQKVLVADDLLATGGTAAAACKLIEKLGGTVSALLFIIELSFLNGKDKLAGYPIHSLIRYDDE